MNHPGALQREELERRRAAPMIVAMLLGMFVLAAVTQVSARVSTGPGDSTARNPSGRLLVLTGIIAYTDPRQGFAIIGSSVEDTYVARPGEHLPDGASIREIYPEHVVLEYGGRLETVGIHGRGEPAEKADLAGVTAGDATLSQAPRLTDEPRIDPRPIEPPASETTVNDRRSHDMQPTDAPQKQAQPEAPLPSALDPANELSDYRRQRAADREK